MTNGVKSSALGWLALASGLLVVACEADVAETEATGQVSDKTWDGDDSEVDTNNTHNYVARYTGQGGICSGVLITPRWILTAAHCFNGSGAINANLNVIFNWHPGTATPDQTFTHSFGTSGPVVRRISNPNPADLNHAAQDLAMFRLDRRVSSDVARPVHISFTKDVCPSGWGMATGFTATSIGFGSSMPNDSPCGSISSRRRYSTHDGWFRFGQVDGAVYNKTFYNSLAFCSQYSGTAKGDSGGAHIWGGHLCGIVSNFTPPIVPFPGPGFLTSNRMAAVDSEESIDWITSAVSNGVGILDAEGNFDGECPAYLETCNNGDCNDNDYDSDQIVDVCDVCPWSDNDVDDDGDGVVDCMDPCPDDRREDDAPACDAGGDFDCDGLCDSDDICPYAANATQKNSNEDVEQRWGAPAYGDACEPVPVPGGDPKASKVVDSFQFDSSFVGGKFQQHVQDELTVRPLRSRRAQDKKTGLASHTPQDVATRFRFCQDDATAVPCDDPSVINVSQLHLEVATPADELPSFRYHRVTLINPPSGINGPFEIPERGADRIYDYNDASRSLRWLYESDAAFWQAEGIVSVPGPEDNLFVHGGPASGLGGRFWMHAATAIGTQGQDVGTGTHGGSNVAGTEQLASRYFELDPEFLTASHWTHPLKSKKPTFIWQTLPDPGPEFRVGIVEGVMPGDAELVVEVEGGDFGLQNLDGTAQPLERLLDEGLRTRLKDASLLWVSPAESNSQSNKKSPVAVGISADSLQITDSVSVTKEGGLIGGGVGGVRAGVEKAAVGAVGTRIAAVPAAAPRTGFVPVFSRSLGMAFLVGGVDRAGRALGDILRAPISGAPWTELVPSLRLGRVLAATYSYRNQSLFVLDSADAGRTRLLRVDARRGRTELIASWAAGALPESAWLGADLEGHVLLSLSSERTLTHAVLRYDIDRRELSELTAGAGALIAPLLADLNGFVLYTSDARGVVRGQRHAELEGKPSELTKLGKIQ